MSVSKNTLTDRAKEAAGNAAVALIKQDMLVGLGTGSTASHFIHALSERCRQGLRIRCVATSTASWELGKRLGLTMLDMKGVVDVDLTVDGADEIDGSKNMIKGGGGALLREKILATISKEMVVVVDEHKCVQKLGAFPLPIEVVTFGFDAILERVQRFGFSCRCRMSGPGTPYLTDSGNYIIDIDLTSAEFSPKEINEHLRSLPGVVETGFFFGLAGRVFVGKGDGTVELWS